MFIVCHLWHRHSNLQNFIIIIIPTLVMLQQLQTSRDGNVTVVRLVVTPTEEQDGEVLTCRAQTRDLPHTTALSTSWNLQVNCKCHN